MAWANEYVGLPWRWGGRDRIGVDCYGLLRMVYADMLEITLPDEQYLDSSEAIDKISERRCGGLVWDSVDAPQPFDVAISKAIVRHPVTQELTRGAHHLSICVDKFLALDSRYPVGVVAGPHPKRVVEWVRHEALR